MRHLESQQQRSLLHWWRFAYRGLQVPHESLLFAIPNAAKIGNKVTAGIRKKEGVRAGIPDLCLAVPRGSYHGLYLEMKTEAKGSRPTPEQRVMLHSLQEQGYAVAIPRGFDQARQAIERYCQAGHCQPLHIWLAGGLQRLQTVANPIEA